jgi:hypothetical protein
MRKTWVASGLALVLLAGGTERVISAEGQAEGSATGTRALIFEGTNGVHIRIEAPADGSKTLTIRGIPGARVRIE